MEGWKILDNQSNPEQKEYHLCYFYKYSVTFISFAVIKYTDESTLWRKKIYFYPQFLVIVNHNMKVTVVRAWWRHIQRQDQREINAYVLTILGYFFLLLLYRINWNHIQFMRALMVNSTQLIIIWEESFSKDLSIFG